MDCTPWPLQNHQPSCMSQRANHNSVNRSDPPGRQTQPWRIGEELGRCDQQRSGERAIFEPRVELQMAAGSSTELRLGILGAALAVNREDAFQKTPDVSCVFQSSHKRVHETTHPFRHVQHSLEISDSQSTHKSNKKNIEHVSIIGTICQICFIATVGKTSSLPRETGLQGTLASSASKGTPISSSSRSSGLASAQGFNKCQRHSQMHLKSVQLDWKQLGWQKYRCDCRDCTLGIVWVLKKMKCRQTCRHNETTLSRPGNLHRLWYTDHCSWTCKNWSKLNEHVSVSCGHYGVKYACTM